jgi:tRNA dimethylallyltransferase
MGPTASGKTGLAVRLREYLPVDIISVDSSQVYRSMDIGTAKPDAEELALAPHRLLDIRDPAEAYSVGEFMKDARAHIDEITEAGRIPLLVGGTMLYFRALLDGLADLPPANPEIRGQIEAEAREHGWPCMHSLLRAVDAPTADNLHPNHSQRIARALEVFRITGTPLSELIARQHSGLSARTPLTQDYRVVQLALMPPDREVLHKAIEQRFLDMLSSGLITEVQQLMARGDLSLDLPSMRAVGYRQVWGFLAGDYDYDEMVAKGVAATRQLAKRQLTWLRKWPGVVSVNTVMPENEAASGGANECLSPDQILTNTLNFLQKAAIYFVEAE